MSFSNGLVCRSRRQQAQRLPFRTFLQSGLGGVDGCLGEVV